MAAFVGLPFQYQQRGPEVAQASQSDVKKYGRFIEQRDQDLENYLAGLSSGLSSAAAFVSTEIIGGGTALTTGVPAQADLQFDSAVGPKFDAATGEWTGSESAWLVVHGRVNFITDGLGFAQVRAGGSALEGSTSLTIVGAGDNQFWHIGGSYLLDAASYNAMVAAAPENILGTFTYWMLSPATTFVDATLVEPATLTIDVDVTSGSAASVAIVG